VFFPLYYLQISVYNIVNYAGRKIMYLHIGENFLISFGKILYILPYKDNLKEVNKEFFEKNKFLKISGKLSTKSLIGCSDGIIYESPIASNTLKKRFNESYNFINFPK
jgi:hypothetical protein